MAEETPLDKGLRYMKENYRQSEFFRETPGWLRRALVGNFGEDEEEVPADRREEKPQETELNKSPFSNYGIDSDLSRPSVYCGNCGVAETTEKFKICLRCKQLRIIKTADIYRHYCSKKCQIEHWKKHRIEHKNVEEDRKKLEICSKMSKSDIAEQTEQTSSEDGSSESDEDLEQFVIDPSLSPESIAALLRKKVKDTARSSVIRRADGKLLVICRNGRS